MYFANYRGLPGTWTSEDLPVREGECVRIGYLEARDRFWGDSIVKLEADPSGAACRD